MRIHSLARNQAAANKATTTTATPITSSAPLMNESNITGHRAQSIEKKVEKREENEVVDEKKKKKKSAIQKVCLTFRLSECLSDAHIPLYLLSSTVRVSFSLFLFPFFFSSAISRAHQQSESSLRCCKMMKSYLMQGCVRNRNTLKSLKMSFDIVAKCVCTHLSCTRKHAISVY